MTKTDLGPGGWFAVSTHVAQGPKGSLVVLAGPITYSSQEGLATSSSQELVRYLPDGRIDGSFGSGGRSMVEVSGFDLSVSDLAVDSQGRVVIFGTATDFGTSASFSTSSYPAGALFLSFATVIRYTARGNLDPTFGGGDGIVMTDFGLPPLPGATAVAVGASAGIVDNEDRPVFIAEKGEIASPCAGHSYFGYLDRLTARLTPAGELDVSFGEGDGVVPLDGVEEVSDIALGGQGRLTLAAAPLERCSKGRDLTVIRLHRNGALDRSFGGDGTRRYRLGSPGRLILDHLGRMYVDEAGGIARLLRSGDIDRTFGKQGVAGGHSGVGLTAVDSHGRVLLTGELVFRPKHRGPTGERLRRRFVVARLNAIGKLDRSFGDGGSVVTGFGRFSNASARDGLIDSAGRLIVVGVMNRVDLEPGGGLALARYRLGR